jgi:3-deoxy-7-phosphoheptulonate synthase
MTRFLERAGRAPRQALQQPDWPDPDRLSAVLGDLGRAPALVDGRECDELTDRLAAVARGEAFLLQGGDCAERFGGTTPRDAQRKMQLLLQMAVVLTYASALPVVKVGRIAGQYAKPRSKPTETRDGTTLPTYRGDAVNGLEFTEAARTPDPRRLRRMYDCSGETLRALRAFALDGGADLARVHEWNRDFVSRSPAGQRYEQLARRIDQAMSFMHAWGVDPAELHTTQLYASHEGLLLDYEKALTRRDERTGRSYAGSGHMLWIGERTRDVEGAHVAYFSTIANPIGVKLGPTTTPDTALELIERLDPDRRPGRLTFIVRMGAGLVRDRLPDLVEKVTASGAQVVWTCDPMHGNTFEAPSGHKTRRFTDILDEVSGFFEVHKAFGTHPGGIHVELTGDEVTECVGGGAELGFDDLPKSYESACDPRLNRSQALDLAFLVAEMVNPDPAPGRGRRPPW